MMLSGKNILVGITGAIAAYKVIELIRMYKKKGADVKVVLTPNALEFVTKTTLQSLSQNQVYVDQFDIDDYKPEHISLADWADCFVIAPASANTIGKIANGLCDNLFTSIACAYKGCMIIAPSMNTGMWENIFVQKNIAKLKTNGAIFIDPEEGFLACGYNGKGRLAEPKVIFEATTNSLCREKFLAGKKILITAGGTKENIDPVRYIGNFSSGKMGLALADTAFSLGAEVTLVSTFAVEKPYLVNKVDSAEQMRATVLNSLDDIDVLVMAAAVSDYKVKKISDQKIKKENMDFLTIELVKNPDILKEVCSLKKKDQLIIGFCAESENLIENAEKKIRSKNCDYIVANDISKSDIGFSSEYNEVYLLDKSLKSIKIDKDTKENISIKIFKEIYGKNT